MLLRFTLFVPEEQPDEGDFLIRPELINWVVNADVGRVKVAHLRTTDGAIIRVYDPDRTAQDRWANALGETVDDA